ncbi:MAG TPA: molybdenum ABC transporter ATP-binding protein [Steroidobacteraceae bacterium]|jgi:molybdate transport system ATP-binding protein|nr:molybdenum ABC transporter ATP-binding protein [Steroidobacteraceae bacterium]
MLRVSVIKHRAEFTLRASFEAPTPGVIALFGRSGSGKTTLVDVIAGLLPPDEAQVQLAGAVLTDTQRGIAVAVERRRIGYVFQDARLFPHLSVLGNLRYGEKRAANEPHYIGFEEVTELLGLGSLLRRRPHELSGGERQRVALGRALLSQPQLLLLDEPLASLDAPRREEVLPYLERLRDWLSVPMVYVSHQFEEVLQLATYIVLLERGAVLAAGPVEEMSLRSELRSVVASDAVGSVVTGVVTAVDKVAGTVELGVGAGKLQVSLRDAPIGSRVRVQLLARDIILATQPIQGLSVRNALLGTVTDIVPDDAAAVLVRVDVGGPVLLARITESARAALKLRAGDAVWALVKAMSTRGHAFRLFGAPRPRP